jgi:hypothetical protein
VTGKIAPHNDRLENGLLVADGEVAAGLTLDCSGVVLVVEIVDPATRLTDVHVKPVLYAAAGIAHYWRLDLDPAPRLHLGHLERGTYTDRLVQAGETTGLADPFPLDLDPAALRR